MFDVKLFEVRDTATCMAVMAIEIEAPRFVDREKWLLSRSGYGTTVCILMIDLGSNICNFDEYNWNSTTLQLAHKYLYDQWKDLKSGDMINVSTEPLESDYGK